MVVVVMVMVVVVEGNLEEELQFVNRGIPILLLSIASSIVLLPLLPVRLLRLLRLLPELLHVRRLATSVTSGHK
jgi:hypothetical protein